MSKPGGAAVLDRHVKVNTDIAEYVFRVPSLSEEIELGLHERTIRAQHDNVTAGQAWGLDGVTDQFVGNLAIFEKQLVRGPLWCAVPDKEGKPVVDHTQFDDAFIDEINLVGARFKEEVKLFRKARLGQLVGPRPAPVAGEPLPQ